MPDSERRRKLISLRLSDEEYDSLKTQYRTFGARNISDLARMALVRLLAGPPETHDTLAAELSELGERVLVLENQLAAIVQFLSEVDGTSGERLSKWQMALAAK
jgi:hypothetical protein